MTYFDVFDHFNDILGKYGGPNLVQCYLKRFREFLAKNIGHMTSGSAQREKFTDFGGNVTKS